MWPYRIHNHSNPRNLLDSEDITERVLGGDVPFRPSVVRRGQLLELIASRMSIPYGHVCCWSQNPYHPAFIQKVLARGDLGALIGSSELITPDNRVEALDEQAGRVADIGGILTRNDIENRKNWLVDSGTGDIHIIDLAVLCEAVRSQVDAESEDEFLIGVYYTRILPWCAALALKDETTGAGWFMKYIRGEGGIPELLRRDVTGRTAKQLEPFITGFPPSPPSELPPYGIHNMVMTLYPVHYHREAGAASAAAGSPASTTYGLPLPFEFEPAGDYQGGIDLRSLFKSVVVSEKGLPNGTDPDVPEFHAVYYDDIATPSSSASRVATIPDSTKSIRTIVVQNTVIDDMVAGKIRRNVFGDSEDEPILYDIRKDVSPQETLLRLVFTQRGTRMTYIDTNKLSEAVVHEDGRCDVYLFGKHTLDEITSIIRGMNNLVLPEDATYYPVQKSLIVKQDYTGAVSTKKKNVAIKSQLLKHSPDSFIIRDIPLEGDKYVAKLQYSLVNLPSTVDETGDFMRTSKDVRKMITAMLLDGRSVFDVIREASLEKYTPGEILEAIDALPEGDTVAKYKRYNTATQRLLSVNLNAFLSELNTERELRELGRSRVDQVDTQLVDIEILRSERNLQVFCYGVPNLEILQNVQTVIESMIRPVTEKTRLRKSEEARRAEAEEARRREAEAEEARRREAEAEEARRREAEAEAEEARRREAEAEEARRREAEAEEARRREAEAEEARRAEAEEARRREAEAEGEEEEDDGEFSSFEMDDDERSVASEGIGDDDEEEEAGFGRNILEGHGRGDGGDDDDDEEPEVLYHSSYRLHRLQGKPLTKIPGGKAAKRTSLYSAIYEDFKQNYSKTCQGIRQPTVITREEYEKFLRERPGSFGHTGLLTGTPLSEDPDEAKKQQARFAIDYKGFIFICPKYWSMKEDGKPLHQEDALKQKDKIYIKGEKDKPINKGRHILRLHDTVAFGDVDVDADESHIYFPGINSKGKPCCFFVGKTPAEFDEKYKRYVTNNLDDNPDFKVLGAPVEKSVEKSGDEDSLPPLPDTAGDTQKLENTVSKAYSDSRWNTPNISMLLPQSDLIDLLGIMKDHCNSFLRTGVTRASACLFRRSIPESLGKYESLYRAVLAAYQFTTMSVSKELRSDAERKELLFENEGDPSLFREKLTRWITPEIFRTLQGGSLMRAFRDTTLTHDETRAVVSGWFSQYGGLLPESLRDAFQEEIEREEEGELLQAWAVSHTRFLEYVSDPREPKLLAHLWEAFSMWPWVHLDAHLGGGTPGRSVFSDGVNLVVIRVATPPATDPPMVLCPGEGGLHRYFRKNRRSSQERPTVIILEDDNQEYQPIILGSRTMVGGKKKITLHGAILPDPALYKSLDETTRGLLGDIWSAVSRFPEHAQIACAPEYLPPVSDIPSPKEIISTINTSFGVTPGGVVVDPLGRITSFVYSYDGGIDKKIVFPVPPTSVNIPSSYRIYPGESGVQESLPEYNDVNNWLSRLRDSIPPEPAASGAGDTGVGDDPHTKMRKTLAKFTPVIATQRSDEGIVIGYVVQGIRLATGLIVPVNQPDEIYTKGTLQSVMGINVKDAFVTSWSSETNDILTMPPQPMETTPDPVVKAVVKSAQNLIQLETANEAFRDVMIAARKKTQGGKVIPRSGRINAVAAMIDELEDDPIVIPDGTPPSERERVRTTLRDYLASVSLSKAALRKTSLTKQMTAGSLGPEFPRIRNNSEIQLTHDKMIRLRASDLRVLDSKRARLDDMFAIGGTPDSLYVPRGTRMIPIGLPQVWKDVFQYKSSRTTAIMRRDNIKAIRMLPVSSDPLMSWESIAVAFRTPLRDDGLNGIGIRAFLVDAWSAVLREMNATRAGDSAWLRISSVLRRENRGLTESSLIDPSLFLQSIREGLVYPAFTDFVVLLNRTPMTTHLALLYAFPPGVTIRDAKRPMVVLGGAPGAWESGTISFLLRNTSRSITGTTDDEESRRYYYSAFVGVRDGGLPYVGSFTTKSNQVVTSVKEKILKASRDKLTWKNVRGGSWKEEYLLRSTRRR